MLASVTTSMKYMPHVHSRVGEMGRWSFSLEVPTDLWCLQDHFKNNPIVPGFLQIEWVRALLEEEMGVAICLVRCDTIKFLSILRPADVFDLSISSGTNLHKVEFRSVRNSDVVALGKLTISRKSALA